MRSAVAIICLAGWMCAGCTEELEPVSYLIIDGFTLVGAAATDRAIDLTAVRAVDGAEALGIYPPPARIPVRADPVEGFVRLEPVVRRAGVASRLTVYPMYEAAEVERAEAPGTEARPAPEIGYAASVEEVLRDDLTFGVTALTVEVDDDRTTSFVLLPGDGEPAFARAEVSAEHPLFEVASQPLSTRIDGSAVRELWLELDYRGDVPLQVALLPEQLGEPAERGPRYRQGVFGRDDFVRFYFDLRDELSDPLIAEGRFRVGLLAAYEAGGPTQQRIDIDNLRVLARGGWPP